MKERNWSILFKDADTTQDIENISLVITELGSKFVTAATGASEHLRPTSLTLVGDTDVRLFKTSFSYTNCVRRIVPKGVTVGASNAEIGELAWRNTSNHRINRIAISLLGFGIDNDAYDFEASFFSAAGACLVNHLYFRVHGEPVPAILYNSLAGIRFIEAGQRMFFNAEADMARRVP